METIDIEVFGNVHISNLLGALVCFVGFFIYHFMTVASHQSIKKFSDVKLSKWWGDNQIKFVLSVVISGILYYTKMQAEGMTVDGAFLIGFSSSVITKHLFKMFSKGG